MKKLLLLGTVAAAAFLLWSHWRSLAEPTGPTVYVLLSRSRELAPGDPVTLKGREIGRVERIEPQEQGVRVRVRLFDERARAIPSDTTFQVERSWRGERRLAGTVLDSESPPFEDGATVEGVDSTLELVMKQGQRKASRALAALRDSDWLRKSGRLLEDVHRAVEGVDWEALGKEMQSDLERMGRDLTALAGLTEEKARGGYLKLKPDIEKLIGELEALGKSREAEELRRHLEELLGKTKES
jgi:hypothetical protein